MLMGSFRGMGLPCKSKNSEVNKQSLSFPGVDKNLHLLYFYRTGVLYKLGVGFMEQE